MTIWRLSANNTHLYPGALLHCQDDPHDIAYTPLANGDRAAVEFADGVLALGSLRNVSSTSAQLDMPDHRTRRGALVSARSWRLVPGKVAGLLRVLKRL